MSEQDWLNRQDPEMILEQLMNEYGTELTHLAFTYLKDWARAEDAVQDTFIKCYKNLDTFRAESSLKTWLYRITINRCKDMLRSWSYRNIVVGFNQLMQNVSSQGSPERDLIQRDENKQMADCVMKLPTKYREVIILYYYSDLKVGEISSMLDKNEKTVRTLMHRARLMLKDCYEEADGHE